MSPTSTPARSIACFDATTARSTGEKSLSFPPKVPNGVRTADRNTTPSPLLPDGCRVIALEVCFLAAIDAELPKRIQLGAAASAMLGGEVLPTMRAVGDGTTFRQRAAAEFAALGELHRAQPKRSRGAVAVSLSSVSAGVLRRDGDAEFLDRFGGERDA